MWASKPCPAPRSTMRPLRKSLRTRRAISHASYSSLRGRHRARHTARATRAKSVSPGKRSTSRWDRRPRDDGENRTLPLVGDSGTLRDPSVPDARLSGPSRNYGDAPRAPRRPPRKARGGTIPGVFDRRATPRGGMHRRPNAAVIRRRATKSRRSEWLVPGYGLAKVTRRSKTFTRRSLSRDGLRHDSHAVFRVFRAV